MNNQKVAIGNPLQIIMFRSEAGLILNGSSPWRKGNHIYVTTVPRNCDRRKAVRVYSKNIIRISTAQDLDQIDEILAVNPKKYSKQMSIFDI